MVNIYVGNLPFSTTQDELTQLFSQHGTVSKSSIIIDRETGRSRGFGFVEMPDDEQARAAIAAFNGFSMAGRPLRVNEAQPPAPRGGGGGGGGWGGGGGRGGRGGGGGGGGGGGWGGGGGRGSGGGHGGGW
ncbi:MAG: RNA-binding protein [Phycisphaerae bacterium]|nr:RNA-binding protein [Phycisphaerae bacterium]